MRQRQRAQSKVIAAAETEDATAELVQADRLNRKIRAGLSPHHVPTEIVQAPDVPRTPSGKKMEVPFKKLMLGQPLVRIANPDVMANAQCLEWYRDFAGRHLARRAAGDRRAAAGRITGSARLDSSR